MHKDYTNSKYGRLTFLSYSHSDGKASWWKVKCDCGKECLMRSSNIRNTSNVSCGCYRRRKAKEHNAFRGSGELGSSFLSAIKSRARYKQIEISEDLTIEYLWELFLKQNRKCPLSGELLILPTHYRPRWNLTTNISLDRIDSNKGYLPGNVQWVTKQVNFMKQSLSQEDFILLCQKIVSHQKELENV